MPDMPGVTRLRLFKLPPGKKAPPPLKFFEIATSDDDRIEEMWTCPVTGDQLPDNIGVATGEGLIVIDVDVRDGRQGRESLTTLIDLYDIDPATYCVRTPSGGLHLYVTVDPDDVIANHVDFLPGIDIRGWHGYVVGAGSIVPEGQYIETTLQTYLDEDVD